jgi:hypothetical protein
VITGAGSDTSSAVPLLLAQFCFFNAILQQIALHSFKEFSGSSAFAPRLLSRKGYFHVVVGCQAIVETLCEVCRPFGFYFPGFYKVETNIRRTAG